MPRRRRGGASLLAPEDPRRDLGLRGRVPHARSLPGGVELVRVGADGAGDGGGESRRAHAIPRGASETQSAAAQGGGRARGKDAPRGDGEAARAPRARGQGARGGARAETRGVPRGKRAAAQRHAHAPAQRARGGGGVGRDQSRRGDEVRVRPRDERRVGRPCRHPARASGDRERCPRGVRRGDHRVDRGRHDRRRRRRRGGGGRRRRRRRRRRRDETRGVALLLRRRVAEGRVVSVPRAPPGRVRVLRGVSRGRPPRRRPRRPRPERGGVSRGVDAPRRRRRGRPRGKRGRSFGCFG